LDTATELAQKAAEVYFERGILGVTVVVLLGVIAFLVFVIWRMALAVSVAKDKATADVVAAVRTHKDDVRQMATELSKGIEALDRARSRPR
jgi:uncharacterized ion transporter superfamily protein YfcC